MKKNKKQKKNKIFIIVVFLILTLSAIIVLNKDKISDKGHEIDQAEVPTEEINKNDQQQTNNEQALDKNEQEPSSNQTNPDKNEQEPVNEEPQKTDDLIDVIVEKEIVADPKAINVLVNKSKNLPDTYVPDDLVSLIDVPTVLENPEINQLRKTAYLALKDMFAAAKDEWEFELFARSGYRSYNTQNSLYKSYVTNSGQAAADKFSAKPGQSEHQTGLAMDITCAAMNFKLDDTFGDTDEGKWVQENAHRFGFIVRYPKGKEDITGYLYEPWHIRFLGVELATKVFESGLTFEEYLEQ